jgi:uncharacterized protein (TIGR02466 family)
MVNLLFPSAVLRLPEPEHLDKAKKEFTQYIAQVKPNCWNVCQSETIPNLDELAQSIANHAFAMLQDQGYNMTNKQTRVAEFWGQEFGFHGQHVEHIHGNGAQITGFYFVDVPPKSSQPMVFDPRAGKKQIGLPQINPEEVTYASDQVILEANTGDLMLFNSWLPHGFTRHEINEPLQFIHFNVYVEDALSVEIV